MIIKNEDIKELRAEIPEGHKHLRMAIVLHDGTELTFQEAAIANIVRAYINIKTHPLRTHSLLTGRLLEERKEGYAGWQLLEEND